MGPHNPTVPLGGRRKRSAARDWASALHLLRECRPPLVRPRRIVNHHLFGENRDEARVPACLIAMLERMTL